MSQKRIGDDDELADARSRLAQELSLWLEFAPDAGVSVGWLGLVLVLAVAFGSLTVGFGGLGIWLAGAVVWALVGRTR